jgi:hypothetical protein
MIITSWRQDPVDQWSTAQPRALYTSQSTVPRNNWQNTCSLLNPPTVISAVATGAAAIVWTATPVMTLSSEVSPRSVPISQYSFSTWHYSMFLRYRTPETQSCWQCTSRASNVIMANSHTVTAGWFVTAHVTITKSGSPNLQTYCVTFASYNVQTWPYYITQLAGHGLVIPGVATVKKFAET